MTQQNPIDTLAVTADGHLSDSYVKNVLGVDSTAKLLIVLIDDILYRRSDLGGWEPYPDQVAPVAADQGDGRPDGSM